MDTSSIDLVTTGVMKEGLGTAAIIPGYVDVFLPRYSWRVSDGRKSGGTWKARYHAGNGNEILHHRLAIFTPVIVIRQLQENCTVM